MNRLLGGLFELIHVLGTAALFGAAAWLTLVSWPSLREAHQVLTPEEAGRVFPIISSVVGSKGVWVAAAALLSALLAPYLRADKAKAVSWGRILLAATAVVLIVWVWNRVPAEAAVRDADVETDASAQVALAERGSKGLAPWNLLLIATAANLGLAAFQVNSGAPRKK